jgi:hypothetical protein
VRFWIIDSSRDFANGFRDSVRCLRRLRRVHCDRPPPISFQSPTPVLVTGEVIGASLDAQCLVGFTRLGNLRGLLDRQDIPEAARHRVWLGRRKSRIFA